MSNLKLMLTRTVGSAGLALKKHCPTILIVAGVAGMVGSTVLACRSTLKVDSIIAEHKEMLEKIHKGREDFDTEKYSDADYRKDIFIAYAKTGGKLLKLYAPAITLGALSITSILSGYNIFRKRHLALVAAYKTVEETYNNYRRRVRDELGEEKDVEFLTGAKAVDEVDEKGKKTGKKNFQLDEKPNHSMYARFFDEYNPYWQKDHLHNKVFLKGQQNFMNDLLNSRGHVFLNEVYDHLGFPHTTEGSVVGWRKTKDGSTDNFIDFGIFNSDNEAARDFVNGFERSVLLDFNVDGVIYDKI